MSRFLFLVLLALLLPLSGLASEPVVVPHAVVAPHVAPVAHPVEVVAPHVEAPPVAHEVAPAAHEPPPVEEPVPADAPAPAEAASGPVPAPDSVPAIPHPPASAPASAGAAPPSDALPGDDDVIGHGKEAIEAVKAARRAPTVAGIAAAIVAGIMLLISVARRFGGMLLTSNQVRLFVVCASALAGGLAKVSDGMAWTEILFVALAPVVSVGVHQVFVKPMAKKG